MTNPKNKASVSIEYLDLIILDSDGNQLFTASNREEADVTDPKTLKNDKERKEWLRNYQEWGIWYKDENIGATYYRYIFENGAQLIVDEYIFPGNKYMEPHASGFHHLVGGPDVVEHIYHETYARYPDNETDLVTWLKKTGGGSTDGSTR